jgi:hypothetical protein
LKFHQLPLLSIKFTGPEMNLSAIAVALGPCNSEMKSKTKLTFVLGEPDFYPKAMD